MNPFATEGYDLSRDRSLSQQRVAFCLAAEDTRNRGSSLASAYQPLIDEGECEESQNKIQAFDTPKATIICADSRITGMQALLLAWALERPC